MPTGRRSDSSRSTASRTTAKIAPSRIKKTGIVGQAKSGMKARKKANAGVADGTVRMGKGGRGYNRYNAKTGRWERVIVTKPKTSSSGSSKKSMKVSGIGRDVTPPGYKSNYSGPRSR